MKYKNKVVLITLACFAVMSTCYFLLGNNNLVIYLKSQQLLKSEEIKKTFKVNQPKDNYYFSNYVPMSDAVSDGYFDDAVFFGDR